MNPRFQKYIATLLLCLFALAGVAATITWYSSLTAATSLKPTDVIAIETSSPQGYKKTTLAGVATYITTNGIWVTDGNAVTLSTNNPVSIYLDKSTNSHNNISFNAEVINTNDDNGFSSLNSVYSTGSSGPTYKGSAILSSANGANAGTVELSSSALTNTAKARLVGTTNGTTAFDLTQDGLEHVGKIAAATFYTLTNTWANAPTGVVDMRIEDQVQLTYTPMSITGIVNKSNTVVQPVVLGFTNGAATNVLLTLAAGISIPQRTNQVAISNASRATLSLRWHPAFGTNAVFVQF